MSEGKPLEDLTYRVIGTAMKVHNALGPGLKEAAYQKALSLEMEKEGLAFEAEKAGHHLPRRAELEGRTAAELWTQAARVQAYLPAAERGALARTHQPIRL